MEILSRGIEAITPFLPYLIPLVPTLIIVLTLAVKGKLDDYAKEAIAAAYKVSIELATEIKEIGVDWLSSPEGKEFRKNLAVKVYDNLPATIYGIPIGVIKKVMSRETFCDLIEKQFQRIAKRAEDIKIPEEPTVTY